MHPMFAERLLELERLDTAPGEDRQRRGRDFERFLHELLASEGLDPRTSYKPSGEEIDGSFVLDGRTFLLEAKWHSDAQAASAVYMFKGKVDGKLVGTLGVFVSMSGFSSDAINAITHGKDLNVILFDRGDISRAVRVESFVAVLRKKLRAAAEQGLVYFDTSAVQVRRTSAAPPNAPAETSEVSADSPMAQNEPALILVCEGLVDEAILQAVVSRVLETERRVATVRFLVAGGSDPLPRLAEAARAIAPNAHVVIVLERHVEPRTLRDLQQRGDARTTLIMTRPLEEWLAADPALGVTSAEDIRRRARKVGNASIALLAGRADLNCIAQFDSAFGQLLHVLREHSSPTT